jgi:hypothetical protein
MCNFSMREARYADFRSRIGSDERSEPHRAWNSLTKLEATASRIGAVRMPKHAQRFPTLLEAGNRE